ncbi:MAG: hypothetical protein QW096_09770 [Thermofilaceae archaeon]
MTCPFFRKKFLEKSCMLARKKPDSSLCLKEFWKCKIYSTSTVSPKIVVVRDLAHLVEKEIELYNNRLHRLLELFAEGHIDYLTYARLHIQYRDKLRTAHQILNLRRCDTQCTDSTPVS